MSKIDNYIYYNGDKYLLSAYTTMAMKAEAMGKAEGYIRKILFRKKHGINQPKAPQLEFLEIPELKLTLVKK